MRVFVRFCAMLALVLYLATPTFAKDLRVNAAAGIAFNPKTSEVVWAQDPFVQRSIASLTKIMTAAVLMDSPMDMTKLVVVQRADVRGASTTYLRANDRVTIDGLLRLMLVGSDNAAARALSRQLPAFIAKMNAKAKALDLNLTHYDDPAGLSAGNVSSAFEVARLLAVVSENTVVRAIMKLPQVTVSVGKRAVTVRSTNHLLRNPENTVEAGKTGFTSRAGFCLATKMSFPNGGDDLVIVVLGAKSNPARFAEVERVFVAMAELSFDPSIVHEGLPPNFKVGVVCFFPDGVSDEGKAFIKWHESFRAKPYRDSDGHYSVGYGMHTWNGKPVTKRYPKVVTRAQADAEFDRQLIVFENIVRNSVCGYYLQSAYDALVSLAWNLGRVNTSILERVRSGGNVTVQDFTATATIRGRVNSGLLLRRQREYALFTGTVNYR